MMTKIEKLYRKIATKYKLDYDVIKRICSYEFKYAKDKMSDDTDTKDILMHHLFKFKCKTRFKNNKI